MQVAVNLSAANLLDPRLPDDVARLLGAAGVPPTALALEITETAVMADPARARDVLGVLRSMRRLAVGRRLRHRPLVAGLPRAPAGRPS